MEGLMSVVTEDLAYRAQAAMYTYAWAADARDIDKLRELAIEDIVVTQTTGTKHGREAFLDIYRAFATSDVELSRHVVSNVLLTREDAGVRVDAYFEATMFRAHNTTRVFGRYSDSMVDIDGSLKLAHKRIQVDRVLELPVATSVFKPYGSD
jgi:hypothetical protein